MFLSDMSGREPLYRKYVKASSMPEVYLYHVSEHLMVIMVLLALNYLLLLPSLHRAFVFFSTPVSKEMVNHIKCDVSVVPRIGALREVRGFLLYYLLLFKAFMVSISNDPLFVLICR